jgi:hypothetical protein
VDEAGIAGGSTAPIALLARRNKTKNDMQWHQLQRVLLMLSVSSRPQPSHTKVSCTDLVDRETDDELSFKAFVNVGAGKQLVSLVDTLKSDWRTEDVAGSGKTSIGGKKEAVIAGIAKSQIRHDVPECLTVFFSNNNFATHLGFDKH